MNPGPAPKEPKKILVVEQEAHTRELLTRIIKLSGYDCEIVATVEEALETLEKTTFDLLITDLHLPESKKLIESSREKLPHIRSICMVRQRTTVFEAMHLSGAVLVTKPFCLDDMIKKIHQTIHEKNLHELNTGLQQLKKDIFGMLG